jgi:hypothetical protein
VIGLTAVVAPLLSLILCHVALAVLMSASSLPERHPCLPRCPRSHRLVEGPAAAAAAEAAGVNDSVGYRVSKGFAGADRGSRAVRWRWWWS